MSALIVEEIAHAYLGRTVLDDVALQIAPGEIVALVGPSGCGKSTLVHVAAGILQPLRGRISRNYVRHAMVFQDPRLMPWATVFDNIAFPLRIKGMRGPERRERVMDALRQVELEDRDLPKYPAELSGGMRQRTAIARALVVEPDFIYFDEPFTSLDHALRRRMQDIVIRTAGLGRFAALFVTHDLQEAARIANRIVVLGRDGRGIKGERPVPGTLGDRDDAFVFATAQQYLNDDPLFLNVHDVDERSVM